MPSVLFASVCALFAAATGAGSACQTVLDAACAKELDLSDCNAVTAECWIQSAKSDNPFFALIMEHGKPGFQDSFRISFNESYRNRRVRGAWGDKMCESHDFAIDDERFHHVALVMIKGKSLALWLDGKKCSETIVDGSFGRGALHVGSRPGREDSREDTFNRFRGYVCGLRISRLAMDAASFRSRTPPEKTALPSLPPDTDPPFGAWLRPETTRRYLHGPLSERILTVWREGKLMYGEVVHKHDWNLPYESQIAHGAWLVRGDGSQPLDFHKSESRTPANGTPIHALFWRDGALEVELEACSPFARKPTLHGRLTIRNASGSRQKGDYALLLRTGAEKNLLFGVPDIYKPYDPKLEQWTKAHSSWKRTGEGVFADGDRFLCFYGDGVSWEHDRGAIRIRLDLAPREAYVSTFAIGRGPVARLEYDDARARTAADWNGEMSRMRLPPSVAQDSWRTKLAENLLKQTLQCMALPSGGGGEPVISRQGGQQRYVWPYECVPVMAALGLYGYGDYVERALSLYFDFYQKDDGEIGPFAYEWAGITASAIGTLSRYCLDTDNPRVWRRYRDKAFRAFRWMQGKRRETDSMPGVVKGLFPPMRSCDWGECIQHWGGTDIYNLEGLRWFVSACNRFGDSERVAVAAEYADYRAAMERILAKFKEECAGRDELRIPVVPSGDDNKLLSSFYPALHYGFFAMEGFLAEDEMMRVKKWLERRGMTNGNGLYGFFPNFAGRPNSHRHIWYTGYGDFPWFLAWMQVGRLDLAQEIFDAQVKWSMTDEFYMGERYDDSCPWYFPWSPNASANGRTLLMLRDLPVRMTLKGAASDGGRVDETPGGAFNVSVPPSKPWPGVTFRLPAAVNLCTNAITIAVSNKSTRLLRIVCDAKTRLGTPPVLRGETTLRPLCGGSIALSAVDSVRHIPVHLDGMEGYSADGNALPYPSGLDQIRVLGVFAPRLAESAEFLVSGAWTAPVGHLQPLEHHADGFFPFVDEFGQFKHDDWSGKIHSDEDLAAARRNEWDWLLRHEQSPIRGADRFGGWADGPQLEATGSFRTAKVDGRWWLVDPDGHLFFSHGIDGIRVAGHTGVTARERYFNWLPAADDPLFARCYLKDGVLPRPSTGFYRSHYPFAAFSFPQANAIRKYGSDWTRGSYAALVHRRLKAWGFNTVGNWSDESLLKPGGVPYVRWVNLSVSPHVNVEGRSFPDVFSPEFRKCANASFKESAAVSGNDPWCIGWFVDNELGWGHNDCSLADAVAACEDGSPAKDEYVRWLSHRRGSPTKLSDATDDERRGFHRHMAETYFRITREALAAAAPGKLYLGCRFAWGGDEAVRAASKYCDVVSWNLYRRSPVMELPKGSADKPIVVGEFHFGALDRGGVHAGVVPARNQEDRAMKYRNYVRDAMASCNIVGVHYFLWRDQPVTGRPDGEDFQVGFVDVADGPYLELVEAARDVAAGMYR